jgi:hypothetical protein
MQLDVSLLQLLDRRPNSRFDGVGAADGTPRILRRLGELALE